MPIIKNKDTQETQDFWSHVEAVAKEVSGWPNWMGNRACKPENGTGVKQEEADAEGDDSAE
jgi:hypothetical protein